MMGFCLFVGGLVWVGPTKAAGTVPVFVSIVPQKYFVEKIGGELVEVSVLVEAGADPHNYEPRPQQMVALSKAKIYYAIGITFEKVWLKRIAAANPGMLIVHSEAGIEKIPMKVHFRHNEEAYTRRAENGRNDYGEDVYRYHGDDGEQGGEHHGIKDPHV
jgi:zinc transport system substrate-binding protein